jgi:hypothetical protein
MLAACRGLFLAYSGKKRNKKWFFFLHHWQSCFLQDFTF